MAQSVESKADQAKQQAQGLVDKAKESAGNLADKARDVASQVGEQVSNLASQAMSGMSGAGGTMHDRAAQGVSAAADGMHSLAGTLRGHADDSGMMGQASGMAADAMDRAGHYLHDTGLDGMTEDVGNLIRRNPIPAVVIGVSVGFVLGRLLRS